MSDDRKREQDPQVEIEPSDEDTEGHTMLRMDLGTAQETARLRQAEIERDVRDRQRAKKPGPNRPRG
jgi:hypothetical protein